MPTMVKTQNLRKSFRRADGSTIEAVKGVDLEIVGQRNLQLARLTAQARRPRSR
ncbi:MAG: hypothetical protein R2873_11025 [Caldilineaceae bacterium]